MARQGECNEKSLAGMVAVVTGAGGGLGRAMCLALAAEGVRSIGVVDIDAEEAGRTAEILVDNGCQCISIQADVTDEVEMEHAAAEIFADLGQVDILVNCVGMGAGGRFEDFSIMDWDRVIKLNLNGVLVPLKIFLPHMKRQGRGHIATFSSGSGLVAFPLTSPYTLTKFALVGLGECLWSELAGTGVGYTTICPTLVRTKFDDHALKRVGGREGESLGRRLARMRERSMEPEEVARLGVVAMKRNKPMVVIGNGLRLIYLLRRICPRLYFLGLAMMGRALNRKSGWERQMGGQG